MAKLNLTKEIALYLKSIRLSSNISAKTMAEHMSKSPAYITKMEKGEIQSLDMDSLVLYLSICYNNDDNSINEAIDYIYQTYNVSIHSSEEEKQSRQSYINFDKVHRLIPLTSELKEAILLKIEASGFNLNQIVDKINQNDDVPDLKNRSDIKPNTWYFENGQYAILLNLNYDEIHNILYSPNTSCNYITIQSILYTIGRLNGLEKMQAMNEAHQVMLNYKFYDIHERHKYLGQDEFAAEHDIENRKKIQTLLNFITAISDQNVTTANSQIDKIINNLAMDIGFSFAFMSIDLCKLKNITRNQKKNFLLEVIKLIDKYTQSLDSNIDMFEDIQS